MEFHNSTKQEVNTLAGTELNRAKEMHAPAGWRFLWPGGAALLMAIPLALLALFVNRAFIGRPEEVVIILGVLFTGLMAVPPALYLLSARRTANPGWFVLIVFAAAGVVLVGIYLFWVSGYVRFPADILIWSEGDFVNDILKFRAGYPLYTAQVNNDSFTYMPGPQLLTYFIAWISGHPSSIPVYRMIQLGYTLIAVILAALSSRKLLEISGLEGKLSNWKLWSAVWLPFLFLAATNSLSNPFVHNLHDDALAQLASVAAFYLLLCYITSRNKHLLIPMAVLPALGFLIKQSLIVWAVLFCLQLAFFERPFNLKRLAIFGVVSFGLIGAVFAGSYLLWGKPFIYWIFQVLGSHSVSPLRSFQHLLDVWVYYVLGFLGGFVLLRGKNAVRILGPWLTWLLMMVLQTYTSGIAWMTNHIGPGSLIAAIWFSAALPRLWLLLTRANKARFGLLDWLRAGMVLGSFCLLLSGMQVFRIPLPPLPQDAYRYIREIEAQFKGQPTDRILLDAGSWVYIPDAVIMKDRAPTIGERGYSQTGDFSGIIQRFQAHVYSKILVRNLNSPEFWYENYLWPEPAGIKQALLDNYHEVGRIKGVAGVDNYLFNDISILEPNLK